MSWTGYTGSVGQAACDWHRVGKPWTATPSGAGAHNELHRTERDLSRLICSWRAASIRYAVEAVDTEVSYRCCRVSRSTVNNPTWFSASSARFSACFFLDWARSTARDASWSIDNSCACARVDRLLGPSRHRAGLRGGLLKARRRLLASFCRREFLELPS